MVRQWRAFRVMAAQAAHVKPLWESQERARDGMHDDGRGGVGSRESLRRFASAAGSSFSSPLRGPGTKDSLPVRRFCQLRQVSSALLGEPANFVRRHKSLRQLWKSGELYCEALGSKCAKLRVSLNIREAHLSKIMAADANRRDNAECFPMLPRR